MNRPVTGEFDLIDRIRARVRQRADVQVGIGDDGAVLRVPAGSDLVVAMDTLNAGVHFPLDTHAAHIGWKALAVNLSDLAAMGATPAWCTLSLSMPTAEPAWVDSFLDGFLELAAAHDVSLVGGDTTRGPLSVCVTVHGFVPPGQALRRTGARIDDDVWVSGSLGDAAASLAMLGLANADLHRGQGLADSTSFANAALTLRERLDRPTPRIALGAALRAIASACIDVSDGLLADLAHVCRASGVGARVDVDALPASAALRVVHDLMSRRVLQATGGDDYELCFTAPPALRARIETLRDGVGVELSRIGRIIDGHGVVAIDAAGVAWQPDTRGYEHFG